MFYPLKVIVEGVRGSNFRSDIAIDDVIFIQGSCSDTTGKSFNLFIDIHGFPYLWKMYHLTYFLF
jgi:hypothetical protein